MLDYSEAAATIPTAATPHHTTLPDVMLFLPADVGVFERGSTPLPHHIETDARLFGG